MRPNRLFFALAVMAGACSKAPENVPKQQPESAPVSGLIGKWCFKPSSTPATWDMIEISKGASYSLDDHFGDGSTRNSTLDARAGGLWERDSTSGDHYVLPPEKGGQLVVADNDGEIGRATALPDIAEPSECFQS